jgi:hypothetical protein
MSWMAISENNSSSAELNAKSLETQIISQNIAKITQRWKPKNRRPTNVLLKNMVVYDVLTLLQTMAFVCSTCVDLDFGVESSL